MATRAIRFAVATTFLVLATMFTSSFAYAQCGCPSGGGDAPKVVSSQKQAMPEIVDLASDPSWKVYLSEQDGIRYLQSNNTTNGLRVEIAQIGATAWVIQANTQPPVTGRTVYRDSKDEVVLYRQQNQDLWIVLPVEAPR